MQDERDIENTKIALSGRPDFNLFDAFRLFDRREKGFVSFFEFEEYLKSFGVYAKQYEFSLLYNRLDINGDDCLEFSEFSNMLKPYSKTY